MLLFQIANGGPSWQHMDLCGFLNALGFNPFTQPNNHPLWYLRALFLLVLMSPVLVFLIGKIGVCFLGACFAFYLLAAPGTVNVYHLFNPEWTFFLRFFLSVQGVFYFSLGIFLCISRVSIDRRFGCFIGMLALIVNIYRVVAAVKGLPWSDYVLQVTIPLMLIGVWLLVPVRPWKKWLTGSSFAIYLTHVFFLNAIDVVCRKFCVKDVLNSGIVVWVVELLFVVGCSVVTTMIIRRLSEPLAKIVFGGR